MQVSILFSKQNQYNSDNRGKSEWVPFSVVKWMNEKSKYCTQGLPYRAVFQRPTTLRFFFSFSFFFCAID